MGTKISRGPRQKERILGRGCYWSSGAGRLRQKLRFYFFNRLRRWEGRDGLLSRPLLIRGVQQGGLLDQGRVIVEDVYKRQA